MIKPEGGDPHDSQKPPYPQRPYSRHDARSGNRRHDHVFGINFSNILAIFTGKQGDHGGDPRLI